MAERIDVPAYLQRRREPSKPGKYEIAVGKIKARIETLAQSQTSAQDLIDRRDFQVFSEEELREILQRCSMCKEELEAVLIDIQQI